MYVFMSENIYLYIEFLLFCNSYLYKILNILLQFRGEFIGNKIVRCLFGIRLIVDEKAFFSL